MKQAFLGWDISSYDQEYPPTAEDGNVFIDLASEQDMIEIEGNSYEQGRVCFRVPVAVMRTWMQEYEKWTKHTNE